MAKRLSSSQIQDIVKLFAKGTSVEELTNKFDCTKATINRNLKKRLGEKRYQECLNKNYNLEINSNKNSDKINFLENLESHEKSEFLNHNINNSHEDDQYNYQEQSFIEISPIDYEIDSSKQKDLSSVPIQNATLPKTVYLIVDKNTELQTKFLKDIPDWQFLPEEDLGRKIIEIYFDIKSAKRSCNKEQKVIKVPNSEVFKIVSSTLLSKGISRIIGEDQLLSL